MKKCRSVGVKTAVFGFCEKENLKTDFLLQLKGS